MISFKFDIRDCYVGAYWNIVSSTRNNKTTDNPNDYIIDRKLYIYIHLIPFFRIIISKKLESINDEIGK